MRSRRFAATVGRTILLRAWVFGAPVAAGGQSVDAGRLLRDIEVLASDRFEGRETCTAGLDSAASYITARFAGMHLTPAGSPATTASGFDYRHVYTARPSAAAHAGIDGCPSQNIVGSVAGTDSVLAREFVIVGAHYDHLGRSTFGALDPGAGDAIRPGADDNASGTAGVMELARFFRDHPTRRSILFVAFSGEEWGLLGSSKFVDDLERQGYRGGRIHAMINFDMIGRLKNDRLIVYGVGTATEFPELLRRHNTAPAFDLGINPDGFGPSDQTSFYAKGIPVLHFFTDTHEDYHRATDRAERINVAGEARVLNYAARVIRDLADRPTPLTLVQQAPPRPRTTTGAQAYLGSVPDMAAGDTPGLRITGITPGSPADVGGLKAGDVVVELGGAAVTDLQSYADALYSHKPGDIVRIIVLRAGQRVTLTVTLSGRGEVLP